MSETLVLPPKLARLSPDEVLARYDYSQGMPAFESNCWEDKGWEHVVTYKQPRGVNLMHGAIMTRPIMTQLSTRFLPVYHQRTPLEQERADQVSWYLYPEINLENPLGQLVLAEAIDLFKEFVPVLDTLDSRGTISLVAVQ